MNATDIFECILKGSVKKLALHIGDIPRSVPKHNLYNHYDYGAHRHKSNERSLKKTITLFDQGMSMGLSQLTTRLLEASCTNIYGGYSKEDKNTLSIDPVREFLSTLASTLQKHAAPPLESVKNMFVALIRGALVVRVPKRPKQPRGWAHNPTECPISGPCHVCKQLNTFLRDPIMQAQTFWLRPEEKQHARLLLPVRSFELDSERSRSPHGLIVYKRGTEYAYNLREYEASMAALEERVSKLRCEYVKSLLGDDLYRELILLEATPESETAEQTSSAAGKKRKADEELDGSSAARPQLIE